MEIRLVSDGTREGTKVFIDGIEMTTAHWHRLSWEFDFSHEAWTIKIDHLSLGHWVSPMPDVASIDISLEAEE